MVAELRDRREVAVRRQERKRLRHPRLGLLTYDCYTVFSDDEIKRPHQTQSWAGSRTAAGSAALD